MGSMNRKAAFFAALIGAAALSCSSAFKRPEPAGFLDPSGQKPGLQRLWARKLNGFVTDLTLSRDGAGVLVATAPNREVESGARDYLLALFDARGKRRWQLEPDAPVRVQAIANDGRTAVVSTYDEKLVSFDANGKRLWAADATCRPFLLSPAKRILCFHDDDAEPAIGFDVFGWEGKKQLSFPIASDALVLKVADDERRFAIGLTRGQFSFFDRKFEPSWNREVPGEILDLDISPRPQGGIAVLYLTTGASRSDRKLAFFDGAGSPRSELAVSVEADRVEFSRSGDVLVLFGNHGVGADLAAVSVPESAGASSRELWRRREHRASDAPAQFAVTGRGILFANGNRFRLVGMDGGVRWSARLGSLLGSDEGASVYAMAYSEPKRTLALAADDGGLGMFRLEK